MMKPVYSCNICDRVFERAERQKLKGLRFTNNRHFEIKDAYSTDGIHLCVDCISQIKNSEADND